MVLEQLRGIKGCLVICRMGALWRIIVVQGYECGVPYSSASKKSKKFITCKVGSLDRSSRITRGAKGPIPFASLKQGRRADRGKKKRPRIHVLPLLNGDRPYKRLVCSRSMELGRYS